MKFLLLFIIGVHLVTSESVHWQWRVLKCEETDKKQASSCKIQLLDSENGENTRIAEFDPCFEEKPNGKNRGYCDIICPGADTAYLIKRSPSNHRSCFGHFTYKIEKRGNNFFLWRDGKCLPSSVEFLVRCEFGSARSDFPADEVILRDAKKMSADLRL